MVRRSRLTAEINLHSIRCHVKLNGCPSRSIIRVLWQQEARLGQDADVVECDFVLGIQIRPHATRQERNAAAAPLPHECNPYSTSPPAAVPTGSYRYTCPYIFLPGGDILILGMPPKHAKKRRSPKRARPDKPQPFVSPPTFDRVQQHTTSESAKAIKDQPSVKEERSEIARSVKKSTTTRQRTTPSIKQQQKRQAPQYLLTPDRPWKFSSHLRDWSGEDLQSRAHQTFFKKNPFRYRHLFLIMDPANSNGTSDRVCPIIRALPITSRIGTILNQIKEMARHLRCQKDMQSRTLFGIRCIDEREELPYYMVVFD